MKRSIIKTPLRYSFYNANFYLIGVNIVMFLFTYLSPHALGYLVLNPLAITYRHWYWQFVTYMFVHGNFMHILFNMLGLFFFGGQVERRMGSSEYLLFYLLTGTLAGVFSFIIYTLTGAYNVYLLGASGAVYAVLLAYATYYPDARVYVMGILPLRAPMLVLGFTAIAVFSQMFGVNNAVAHLTHLAGFGFAFFYFLVRLGINPIKSFFGGGRPEWH